MKKTISKAALIARIRRALRNQGENLKITRGMKYRHDLGDYYVQDNNRLIVQKDVDLVELGRELEVLASSETVEEE